MSSVLASVLPWLVAVGVTLLALLGLTRTVRRSGRDAERSRALEDAARRQEAGRKAAAEAEGSGKRPDEIVRDNDGRWQ